MHPIVRCRGNKNGPIFSFMWYHSNWWENNFILKLWLCTAVSLLNVIITDSLVYSSVLYGWWFEVHTYFQDARRDRSLQISTERGDTDKVYQTIGAPERARSPAKSILKKSSTNPDLLSEVKRQSSPGSPIRDRSPNRAGKSRLTIHWKTINGDKLLIKFN